MKPISGFLGRDTLFRYVGPNKANYNKVGIIIDVYDGHMDVKFDDYVEPKRVAIHNTIRVR